MNLSEAIKHCLEVAENCEEQAKQCDSDDRYERHVMHENAKCAADHRQLAEWLTELKEAKRLLKAAVEDLDSIYCKLGDNCEPMPDCGECPYIPSNQGCYCKWRYADEALKLIEG